MQWVRLLVEGEQRLSNISHAILPKHDSIFVSGKKHEFVFGHSLRTQDVVHGLTGLPVKFQTSKTCTSNGQRNRKRVSLDKWRVLLQNRITGWTANTETSRIKAYDTRDITRGSGPSDFVQITFPLSDCDNWKEQARTGGCGIDSKQVFFSTIQSKLCSETLLEPSYASRRGNLHYTVTNSVFSNLFAATSQCRHGY